MQKAGEISRLFLRHFLCLFLSVFSIAEISDNLKKGMQSDKINCCHLAVLAELADAQDLGSCVARREGSSPLDRTDFQMHSPSDSEK